MSAESRAEVSGEGWKGQGALGDLHDLLTEIQALRAQLERSIDTNSTLQGRLEEQLAEGGRKAPEAALMSALQTLSTPEQPLPVARNGTAPTGLPVRGGGPVCLCPRASAWVLSIDSRHAVPWAPGDLTTN